MNESKKKVKGNLGLTFNSINKINAEKSNNKIENKSSKSGSKISKKSENQSNADSKNNNDNTSIKSNKDSSYMNSAPMGEDSTEINEYYKNEEKEKEKEKNEIKESQKKYDEDQNNIIKSFTFEDFKKPSKVSLENDGDIT